MLKKKKKKEEEELGCLLHSIPKQQLPFLFVSLTRSIKAKTVINTISSLSFSLQLLLVCFCLHCVVQSSTVTKRSVKPSDWTRTTTEEERTCSNVCEDEELCVQLL